MDKAAQKQIKKKAGAWTRYQESSNYEKYLEYTKIRNKATKQLKNTKREFEKYIAANCKKNPKVSLNMQTSNPRPIRARFASETAMDS